MDRPRAVLAARQAVRAVLTTVPAGSRMIVACSGGSDSLALALALAAEAPRAAIIPSLLTVDHGILPGSAGRAEQLVERMSQYLPSRSVRIDAGGEDGPEGSARAARYRALAEEARRFGNPSRGPALVLLGHTMDDQAETVLMGLGRGSGPRSIAGMRPVGLLPGTEDVPAARPLLGLTREDLQQACRQWGEQWWDDPSNRAEGPWRTASGEPLRRAAIRDYVLPELSAALGQDVREPLARTAELLREDLDYLDKVAEEALEDCRDGDELLLETLRGQPVPVRTRVVRLWLLEQGARAGELTSTHVRGVTRLLEAETGKGIDVPGLRASRTRHSLKRAVE
ncbi:tRNA lysidine(34) synthetase TilS [Flaviflexus ciconiae]|uniref:tRNA(Ile)-lysidine synthase n=1 Tax=Flaviflexus ciconiae TaxID=2496867 RepID=A0A3Q9G767_9ACTO|nr:tRNA lysidine(34) synthetase TilS [Flaviflexus ciconiae]AZQ77229.1 tRNA lysidine(34) synthetase TilS [Flaviflexus ciconiae]